MNVAVVDPDATTTEAGALKTLLLLESATVPPLLRDRITVQVVWPLLCRVAEAHVNEVSVTAGVSAIDAVLDEPFREAVTVTV